MAITSDDKLKIYNGALRRLGSRQLLSLTENRHPRRVLDQAWGSADDAVKAALEKGEWNFAIRSVEIEYSPSIEPSFGHNRAYPKPDDFRRLAALCSDGYFQNSLTDEEYTDEAGYWFCSQDVLFIRYVSDHNDFGLNSAGWTEAFRDYLETAIAWEICETITNSTSKRDRLDRDMRMALTSAKSVDSMNDGVKFLPSGSWSRSRVGGFGSGRRG